MKLLLKENSKYGEFSGKWVTVDTDYLFNNQYNVKEFNMRIMDGYVQKIEDDVRAGKGKCKWCGKIVVKGEEENHFEEMERKYCDGCFWGHGEICRFVSDKGGINCQNYEHRKYGINWFTPKNTFFLKYPNGYEPSQLDIYKNQGFFQSSLSTYSYYKKLGSYTIEADLDNNNNIQMFQIYNSNKHIFFMPKENGYIVIDHGWDYKFSKILDVPFSVQEKLDKIFLKEEK